MRLACIIGTVFMLGTAGCSLLEPQGSSLVIAVRSPGVAKPGGTLRSVQCRVGLERGIVYWEYMEEEDGTFSATIPGLDPARGYYVLLHGKGGNYATQVVCCAFQNNIDVGRNEEKTVTLEWEPFVPQLINPAAGDAVESDTVAFSWTSVNGAVTFDWALGVDERFWPATAEENLSGLSYTLDASGLSHGRYYWKVRCYTEWISSGSGSYTQAGPWSEIMSFTIE